MALTRPKLQQFDTTISSISDPITVLKAGTAQANIDIGFLMNRANGLVSNVAVYWSETAQQLITGYTTANGAAFSNIAVSDYVPFTTGNLLVDSVTSPASKLQITSNVTGFTITAATSDAILGSLALAFGGNSSIDSFMVLAANGGRNYIDTRNRDFYIKDNTGAFPFYLTQANGNVSINSTTTSTSTTTGALTVKGGTGIGGNIISGGYHYITPTAVTDAAGGTYGTAIAIPGNAWGIYANIATAGTAYLRQVIGKDSGNNIVIGHSATGLNANVIVFPGTNGSFNILNAQTASPLFTVNSTANTVVISNSQTATSTTTGALQVAGGVGIGGAIFGGGGMTMGGNDVNFVNVGTNINLGTAQVGGTLILGGPTQTGIITVGQSTVTQTLTIAGGVTSAGNTKQIYIGANGAANSQTTIIVGPTAGSGNVFYQNGTQVVVANTQTSISTTTGALQVTGGVGIGGNLNVGGNLSIAGNLSITGNITSVNYETVTNTDTVNTLIANTVTVGGNITTGNVIGTVYAPTVNINSTAGMYNVLNITGTALSAYGSSQTWKFFTQNAVAGGPGSWIVFPDSSYQYTAYPGTNLSGQANLVITNLNAATIGNTGAVLTGTISTAAQPNITSLGTLTGLTISGNTAITNTLYAQGIYDNGTRVVSTSSGAGNLTISGTGINLTAAGPGATTVGGSTAIPVITTDAYGRIASLSTASITTTLSTAGTSGTGTVALASQSLTFAGTYGVTASASGQTITVATPQDLQTTASPIFNNGVFAGNVNIAGTLTVANLQARGSSQLVVQDPMTYFQSNLLYPWSYDTGLYSDSIGGPANVYAHHGMVRSVSNGYWGFFSNVKSEPDSNINWNDAGLIWDKIKAGSLILANTTNSTSTTTGALVVSGGAGFDGNVYVTGNVYSGGYRNLNAGDLSTVTYTANYITMNPSLVPVPTVGTATTYGTYNFGTVANIQTYGDYNEGALTGFYSVNDAATAPGHVEYIGFTGVSDFNRLVMNVNYTAASGHTQDIDLYNYSNDTWDTFGTYTGNGSWQTITLGVISAVPYISNTGNVTLRNYHLSTGNVSHRTWFDYIALEKSIVGGQGPRGPTGATGATGAQGNVWSGGVVANVTYFSSNVVANSGVTSTSTTSGALTVVGGAGITGNIVSGGSGQFQGLYNENTSSTGVFLGNAGSGTPSPRIGLFNGTTSQNWQIDNYSGTFRWFTPGVTRMQLDTNGNLAVNGLTTVSPGSQNIDSAFVITGNVWKGGVGYHDFMRVTSTYSSVTNPNKYFRLDSIGQLQIINSAYNSNIFNLTDGGDLTVGGTGYLKIPTGTSAQRPSASAGMLRYNTDLGAFEGYTSTWGSLGGSGSSISGVTGYSGNSAVLVTYSTSSTSTTSGALQVMGGLGVGGNVWAGQVYATNNGNGTNFAVGDDAWIGDINVANTSRLMGQQDATQGYLVFGNSNTTNYIGRSGTNPLTVTGPFNVTGNTSHTSTLYAQGIYDNGTRVVSTSSGAGNLTISGTGINLTAVGPGVTTVGSSTAIPVITTDAYGRITALTSSSVSTTISLAGTTGTGSVAGGGTLTFAGSNGFTATVSSSTVTLSSAQDIRTTASPVFAGGNFTGNVTRNSRAIVTNYSGNIAPTSPVMGDEWFRGNTGVMYKYLYDNVSSTYNWINISSALYNASTSATASTLALRDSGGNLTATNFLGTASSAKYADLAEIYASDSNYEPGTVVVFGGTAEITVTKKTHDTRVAGVISTNPAYLMNSEAAGLPVAFTGRVPCLVRGPVSKGDVLVTSAYEKYAERMTDALYRPGCILGKSLDDVAENVFATIEVVVGRF